jgi:regulator of sigma E protease
MSKKITLLGSTGSIGTQSLDVIRAQGYEVFGLSAHSHVDKILQQIEEFHPRYVCMTDSDAARRLDAELSGRADAPRLLVGPEGLKQLAALDGTDVVLNSVVGIAGLGASLCAIESGHDLALANKESLVTGGHLVTQAVAKHGVKLLPVDSEHSAIFQCLQDKESAPSLTKILLTASGGPFFGMKTEELRGKTKADAIKHPNWNMGAKITIDSATLMNKGLELIEAVWLRRSRSWCSARASCIRRCSSAIIRSLLSWVCRICAFPSSMRSPTQSAYPALCRSWTLPHSRCSPSMWQTTRPSAALPPAKRPSKREASAHAPPTVPMKKLSSSSLRTKLASSILAVWWKQSWTATALAASIPSAMCTSATAWRESSCAHIFESLGDAMSIFITLIAALIVFSAVIAIHEFGHFTVAKLCGIQVNEFSIGMGPALWKKIYKGTQYSLRALPVGGYVALEGEESPESQQAEAARDEREAEDENPVPPEQRTGIPLNEAPVWQRVLVMVAGAFMNFVLGFVVLVILVAAQEGAITSKTIYSIENDALCGQTGLQAGDEIVAVNGRRCFVANDILYELVRTEAYRARFTVKRDGQKVELPDVQFDTWQDEDGQTHMTLGFTVYGIKKTPLNVLKEAWNSTLYYGRIVFTSLADLVRGRESINNLSGPVGIVTAIGQAASYGWQDLLELLALITINLGVFNLLPFPALDGGKVVFLIIEGVTGHAVPEKLQGTLTIAAFALLFGLMLFATYNDIIRLVTGVM